MWLFGVGVGVFVDIVLNEVLEYLFVLILIVGFGVGEIICVLFGEMGYEVFLLIFGVVEFGWNVDFEISYGFFDCYMEFGGNVIYMVDGFFGGCSEYIIGQWLWLRGCWDCIFFSVCIGVYVDNFGLGLVNLVCVVEGFLMCLGVECIDVVYFDVMFDVIMNFEDIFVIVEWLVEVGKIGVFGVYGFVLECLVEVCIFVVVGYLCIYVIDVLYNFVR